jgi:hypothetical protein
MRCIFPHVLNEEKEERSGRRRRGIGGNMAEGCEFGDYRRKIWDIGKFKGDLC